MRNKKLFSVTDAMGVTHSNGQVKTIKKAWIDVANEIISFSEINNAFLYEDEEQIFWIRIKALGDQGYRFQ